MSRKNMTNKQDRMNSCGGDPAISINDPILAGCSALTRAILIF